MTFERDGKVPLFVETGQRGKIPRNDEWHTTASRLLDLPPLTGWDTNYIGNAICWRRENVLALHERLEHRSAKKWQMLIAKQMAFSEYILYGMFVERLLGDRSGHWPLAETGTLPHWNPVLLDLDGLRQLAAQRQPQHHSVMISAKSRTAVDAIRKVFF